MALCDADDDDDDDDRTIVYLNGFMAHFSKIFVNSNVPFLGWGMNLVDLLNYFFFFGSTAIKHSILLQFDSVTVSNSLHLHTARTFVFIFMSILCSNSIDFLFSVQVKTSLGN